MNIEGWHYESHGNGRQRKKRAALAQMASLIVLLLAIIVMSVVAAVVLQRSRSHVRFSQWYNEDISFVTAFIDIGRHKWNEKQIHGERDVNYYVDSFAVLAKKLPLIAYVDATMSLLLGRLDIPSWTTLRSVSDVDTFMKHEAEDQRIIDSEAYKHLIPAFRKNNPEHRSAAYCLVNHSKFNFVAHAAQQSSSKFVAWVDFGIASSSGQDLTILPPSRFDCSRFPEDMVTIQALAPPPATRLPPGAFIAEANPRIAGGFFVMPTSLASTFESIYKEFLVAWRAAGICDDDQAALYEIWSHHPKLLNPIYKRSDRHHSMFFLWQEFLHHPFIK